MSLHLTQYTDSALLLMRFMVGFVFGTSGWYDLKDPVGRGKSFGLGAGATILLGIAETAGALGLIWGVLTQYAAIGLILLGLGAIQSKVFVWHTGIWGKHGTDGWHYDLMLLVMNLVIVTTGGGKYVLLK
jgi:putative oxidoreductase